ncbi:exodeoxyribonuclease VII small subunit [Velocimicrobium porci]|mgnify:CR=1 FL=1|uniref:Exodeoxyribonuclease 7 small subunit n=1 Tax=Velocimicrobium porci TaxID=2606634 RepID=A0A6L5XYA6_9FIRM|nr:exodeoxyribonuclease VII small subunit [Velocimicrobium porci]MSS63752.1 exodeoxyribonuclease VII small subunit [Velocimicrobium porci]
MAKAKSLEDYMEELEKIMNDLEREDLALEEAFKLYHNGMKVLKSCNDAIDKVEKKLIVLEEE